MLIVFKKCHFNYLEYIMSTNLLQNEDMGFGLRYNILVKQLQYLTSVL